MRDFFFEAFEDADGDLRERFRWRRLLATLAALTALGWIGSTLAGWTYLRHYRQVATVSYIDVLLPWRWSSVRVNLGDQYLAEASAAIERSEYDVALHLYRTGLARSPFNRDGRIGMARLYVSFGRPELAKQILADSIVRFSSDIDYLRTALTFFAEFQYDQELLQCCDQLLAGQPSPETRRLAALFGANAAFHRGNYDRAEALLREHNVDSTPDGSVLLARADLERGYAELALVRLNDLVDRELANDSTFVLLSQVRRQLGQTSELQRNATLRLANNPLSHAPRIDLLFILHERGEASAVAKDVADYLRLFRREENALLALADFAATTGRPDITHQVQAIFRENGWSTDATNLLAAEANLAAQRYREGLLALDLATRANPEAAKRLSIVLDSLRAVALFGLNRPDEARLNLEHLLAQPNLRADNLQVVAARLVALGQSGHARAVLARAAEVDPLNQVALTELVRLDAEGRHFDTLPARVRRLMEMRKPSRAVLALVARAWSSDLNLLHPEQSALLHELRARTDRAVADGG